MASAETFWLVSIAPVSRVDWMSRSRSEPCCVRLFERRRSFIGHSPTSGLRKLQTASNVRVVRKIRLNYFERTSHVVVGESTLRSEACRTACSRVAPAISNRQLGRVYSVLVLAKECRVWNSIGVFLGVLVCILQPQMVLKYAFVGTG